MLHNVFRILYLHRLKQLIPSSETMQTDSYLFLQYKGEVLLFCWKLFVIMHFLGIFQFIRWIISLVNATHILGHTIPLCNLISKRFCCTLYDKFRIKLSKKIFSIFINKFKIILETAFSEASFNTLIQKKCSLSLQSCKNELIW